ncbi:hypothetical protein CCR75_006353 [Bremia lactucae]|uniref:Uncharacterized protein n=1 Tax=Bremia lactucae TaxID=4779 RepID=A0A976P093_BRELC|nr:hypothetical protein CCR75_006353 [Bremia lactucae]
MTQVSGSSARESGMDTGGPGMNTSSIISTPLDGGSSMFAYPVVFVSHRQDKACAPAFVQSFFRRRRGRAAPERERNGRM